MKMIPLLDHDDLVNLQLSIIVESFNKYRHTKKFRAEFDANEQRLLTLWYPKLYRWTVSSGLPQAVPMSEQSLALLKKAVVFFASV